MTQGTEVFVAGERPASIPAEELYQIALQLSDGLRQGIYENPADVQDYIDLAYQFLPMGAETRDNN